MEITSEDEVQVVRDIRNTSGARLQVVRDIQNTSAVRSSPLGLPRNWRAMLPNNPSRITTATPVIDDDDTEQDEAVGSQRREGISLATSQALSSEEEAAEADLFNFGTPQLRYMSPHQRRRPHRLFTPGPRMSDLLPRNSTPARVPVRPSARSQAARKPSRGSQAKKPQHEGLKELTGILTRLSQQLHVLSQRRMAEKAAENATGDGPAPETCPICFEAFHCPGTCTTRCGHVFHRKCLDACLQNSRACPVCRASVHRAELIDLMSGFGEGENAGEAVVDLVNEPVAERGALDESILQAVQSVKKSIDTAHAVDNLDSDIRKENQELKREIETREQELEVRQKRFEQHMEGEKGRLEKKRQRVQKGEEVISEKDRELNHSLIELRKQESALKIREGEVEAGVAENQKKRHELEVQISSLQDKTRRMSAIQNRMHSRVSTGRSNEMKERIAVLERTLRNHRIPLPEDAEKEETTKETPGRDAFMMDLDGDVTVVESAAKKRRVNAPAKAVNLVFGSELRKPSVYSRPPPPRRGGRPVGVRSFTPEKKIAQRIGGVAQRGLNRYT